MQVPKVVKLVGQESYQQEIPRLVPIELLDLFLIYLVILVALIGLLSLGQTVGDCREGFALGGSRESSGFPEGRRPEGKSGDLREFPWAGFFPGNPWLPSTFFSDF